MSAIGMYRTGRYLGQDMAIRVVDPYDNSMTASPEDKTYECWYRTRCIPHSFLLHLLSDEAFPRNLGGLI